MPSEGYIHNRKNTPDPVLVKDQLEMLQWFYNEYGIEAFARFFFWILAKREDKAVEKSSLLHSRYVPFQFNSIQRDIVAKIAQKNICLKPRQIGLTTFFLIIRCLLPSILNPGTNGFLVSQNNEYASKHFKMLKRALNNFGVTDPANWIQNDLTISLRRNLLHTTASNRKEIILDQLDNSVGIGSAEVEETGQGITLHWVVCSEVARWPGKPEETLANLKEAIVLEGTLDLESTPNGAQGYFYDEFRRAKNGESDFVPHFHEWWTEPSYQIELTDKQKEELAQDLNSTERKLMEKISLTLQQVAFRREKKISLRHNFEEKYPEDPINCLDGRSCVVLADGSTKTIEHLVRTKYSGKVLSVDSSGSVVPARVINWYRNKRNGRKMYKLYYENAPNANNTKAGVLLTEDHKVLTTKGWLRADQCNGESVATGTIAPGDRAFQIIIGSLLGDAHISKREGTYSSGQIDRQYVRLKHKVLKSLNIDYSSFMPNGANCLRVHRLTGRGRLVPYFRWLRRKWYPDTTKHFPLSFVSKLNDFGIAIWFMDDGWGNMHGHSPFGGLATGLAKQYEVDELVDILCSKGYECSCKETNGGAHRYIRFTTKGFIDLIKAIGKYIPPSMRYKLPKGAPKYEPEWFAPEQPKQFFDRAVVREIVPRMQYGKTANTKNKLYEKGPVYCLDVEGTHNFVTLGGVVHNCFLLSGGGFFDKTICMLRNLELEKEKDWFATASNGELVIYKQKIPGRQYVIGADPASGKQITTVETDYSAFSVIDLETGEDVASFVAREDPVSFAMHLAELGREYNNALIGVERGTAADSGGEGGTVITTLVHDCQYNNIYKHKEWLRRDKKTKGQNTILELEGLPMNGKTRPIVCNRLKHFVENEPEKIKDKRFIEQAMQFVRDEMGRPAASEGNHDDIVIAKGIAHYVRLVLLGYVNPTLTRSEKYGMVPREVAQPEDEESLVE